MSEVAALLPPIRRLHEQVRAHVVAACERSALAELARVAHDQEGDTIYAVDRVGEELLVECAAREIASIAPVVLVAEGLGEGPVVLPRGTPESAARWRILIDPIDGTRGLMYQKRSAWILTGVARNRGAATRLIDVELAVQTEVPLVKQHQSDVVWAVRGEGAHAERWDRVNQRRMPLCLRPSTARTVAHGFAQIARFFPGARDVLAAIDDEIARGVLGPIRPGKAQAFEDQYISSGGQLFELMAGHDRFVADLRPLLEQVLRERGESLGICCHPYDVCTALIARELGVEVVDVLGRPLDAPFDLTADVAWVGYANPWIRRQVEPLLHDALRRRGLLPAP